MRCLRAVRRDAVCALQVCAAKAGLTAQMPARATVIAAANPIGGTFNIARSVRENVKMSAALFSRFDLVFPVLDERDEARDATLSKHVMSVHCGGASQRIVRALIVEAPGSKRR